jgi:hypothetical protein
MRAVRILALTTVAAIGAYLAFGVVVSVLDIDTNIDTGNVVANSIGFGLIALCALSIVGLIVSALYQVVVAWHRKRT